MDWILFLHIFTIINKVLLFPLYFFRKNNSGANRMLAFIILLPVFPILSNYVFYTCPIADFPHSLFVSQVLFSFFGPIYFFYCMEMLGKPFKFTPNKLLHLLPSFCLLILWLGYTISGEAAQTAFAHSFLESSEVSWQRSLAYWAPIVLVFSYVSVSAWAVYRHIVNFKAVFTHLDNFKIGYITEFLNVMIAQILLLGILSLFSSLWYLELVWVPVFGNLMYFYIVYKSYQYGVVFSDTDYQRFRKLYEPLNQYIADHKLQKYANSHLSTSKIEYYAELLAKGFETERWYLDPELTLTVLSEKTGIPSYAISQVLNQQFGKNFFDFVNCYRIEVLKERLIDKKYDFIKIEELAYMSGFNSKAAFQRAFKKHTGTTPTLYKRRFQAEVSEL